MTLPVLIAKFKAEALLKTLFENSACGECLIITTDQVVLYGDDVREKPSSLSEAAIFLKSYSENKVSTISGVVVTHYPSNTQVSGVDVSTVNFSKIENSIIDKLVEEGDVMYSAGGFLIESPHLAPCIEYISGSIDSIMGFPIDLTVKLIQDAVSTAAATQQADMSR
jgi:septum formation protein